MIPQLRRSATTTADAPTGDGPLSIDDGGGATDGASLPVDAGIASPCPSGAAMHFKDDFNRQSPIQDAWTDLEPKEAGAGGSFSLDGNELTAKTASLSGGQFLLYLEKRQTGSTPIKRACATMKVTIIEPVTGLSGVTELAFIRAIQPVNGFDWSYGLAFDKAGPHLYWTSQSMPPTQRLNVSVAATIPRQLRIEAPTPKTEVRYDDVELALYERSAFAMFRERVFDRTR